MAEHDRRLRGLPRSDERPRALAETVPQQAAPRPDDSVAPAFQVQGTCASCHARRYELTGDFKPGDSFFDHYSLTIVDQTDLYYPDGQVRDEDYEFASFLSSRMRHSEIRCLDCHNPHSMKTILPGNQLCLRCHNGSYPKAPVIDPGPHSFHSLTNTGSRCVSCHMPTTPYMQRHWRHDHGFTIPDPLLTRQLGIPNACNRCHADQSVAWALASVEKWYGTNMLRHTRERAQWIAAARQGDASARDHLLSMFTPNEPPYWQAVAVTLLERWMAEPPVTRAALAQLQNEYPLVREKAVRALDPLVEAGRTDVAAAVGALLEDETRCVRVAAAWVLRTTVDPKSRAGRELERALNVNADQPGGQMQLGAYCLARQQLPQALEHFQKAVAWDPNSAPLRHELAVLLSLLGRHKEALRQIQEACRLDPKEAEYQFKLGLAWAELGNLEQTVRALQQAVKLGSAPRPRLVQSRPRAQLAGPARRGVGCAGPRGIHRRDRPAHPLRARDHPGTAEPGRRSARRSPPGVGTPTRLCRGAGIAGFTPVSRNADAKAGVRGRVTFSP